LASTPTTQASLQPPVSLAERSIAALVIVAIVAALYTILGVIGVVPIPRSISALAGQQQIGHQKVIVSGYYVTQSFIAMGGAALPPYIFASDASQNAPGVHVAPELPDVKAGRVAAIIDTATGDGSEGSPYAIHTLARWDTFVTWVIVGCLVAVAFAFWVAGSAATLVRRKV
jgi:hypothetical protein